MGNYRYPHNDFVKEMDSDDREFLGLSRPKLDTVRPPGIKGINRPRNRQGKTADNDQMGETGTHDESKSFTEIKGSEEKISKKTSAQTQSVPGKSEKKSALYYLLCILSLGILIVAASSFSISALYTGKADKSDQFDFWFRKMENDFPEQYDFTWQILNSSLTKFLNAKTNSLQPTIILMLGTGNNRDTVNCLSDRVKTIVQDVFEDDDCPGIKSEELAKSNDTILKLEMERNMTYTLSEMKCHALVIEDIDLLREAGLNLLQAYCDHENAPHKFVSIILTATTKKKLPTSLPKDKPKALREFQQMAREHLDDAWKTVSSDYREAWLSRFMQYVVVTGELSQPPVCANKH